MSFLNLPWRWSRREVWDVPIEMSIVKWDRGPIALYMYEFKIKEAWHTQFVFCFADECSIAIHLPAVIMTRVRRWLGCARKEST